MTPLDRKLLRDLRRLRAQALAIAAVIAAGLAVSVLGVSNIATLTRSQQFFYDEYRFGDLFVSLKRAPDAAARRLSAVPGVAAVETRIVASAMADMPGVTEPIAMRLVGIPASRRPLLNDLAVDRGAYLSGAPDDVLVSRAFAAAHALDPGDTLTVVLNDRRQQLRIVGIALSPEFVYAIRPGSMFPDDRRFGILWADERIVAAAFDLDGAFNDAVFRLEPHAAEQRVIEQVDAVLEPYGGAGAYGRGDQLSHWVLDGELSELRTTGRILPSVFSLVAAFLLHIVITRLVATQREQIGLLRAFGYSRAAIAMHYAKLALAIAAVGAAAGVPGGVWLAHALSGIYGEFFHFPRLLFTAPPGPIVAVTVVAAVIALGGSLGALRGVMRISPAVALRPPAPASFRPTRLERLGLHRRLAPWMRMLVRNLERRPLRAALALTAIAMATAIVVLGRFGDSLRYVMDVEFSQAQRQSGTLTFVDPQPERVLRHVLRLPGVEAAEPFRAVPVRFVHGQHTRRGAVTGLVSAPQLMRPLDVTRRPVPIPREVIVLSEKLAELLHVGPGAVLTLETLEGARHVRATLVTGTVRDYLGTSAFMHLPALNALMGEGPLMSGAHLLFDERQEAALFQRVKETPGLAGLTIMRDVRRSFADTLGRSLLISLSFLIAISGVIAFAVVFNTTRITLAERAWELATLRVLGFTRREVGGIVVGEVGLVVAAAIPAGLLLGSLLTHVVARAYDTDLYRLPAVINPSSYLFAAVVVAASGLLSAAVVWRLVRTLDLVSVLKARE